MLILGGTSRGHADSVPPRLNGHLRVHRDQLADGFSWSTFKRNVRTRRFLCLCLPNRQCYDRDLKPMLETITEKGKVDDTHSVYVKAFLSFSYYRASRVSRQDIAARHAAKPAREKKTQRTFPQGAPSPISSPPQYRSARSATRRASVVRPDSSVHVCTTHPVVFHLTPGAIGAVVEVVVPRPRHPRGGLHVSRVRAGGGGGFASVGLPLRMGEEVGEALLRLFGGLAGQVYGAIHTAQLFRDEWEGEGSQADCVCKKLSSTRQGARRL